MPKSRNRKGRKPYRPKPRFAWGADPLDTFKRIGSGELDHDEEEAACKLLLHEMAGYDPEVMKIVQSKAGLSGPPVTTDDIRAVAKALTGSEPAHAPQP